MALSGGIPFLNSGVLLHNYFSDSSYRPPAGSKIHLHPSHPCFQVSYFGNIIWLPNYQHSVEKQPDNVLKHPQGTPYLPIPISIFLFSLGLQHPGKPWKAAEGLEESFLDTQDNVKVKLKWPFPKKEKAAKT